MVKEKTPFTYREASGFVSELAAQGSLLLLLVLIYATIQLFRSVGNDNLLLLVGSILSIVGFLTYPATTVVDKNSVIKRRKGTLFMFLSFSGFIPWLFGSYLTLYKGFWSLKDLLNGFSLLVLLKSLSFIVVGYAIVSKLYKISKFGRLVSEGKFVIKD